MPVTPRSLALPLVGALLVAALFLSMSGLLARALAFPLDDAWIHQTYARTLAEHGVWGYRPGQPSSGSTAPLWTVLLVPGHLLPLSPTAWGYLIGIVGWLATIVLGGILSFLLFGERQIAWWSALALAAEWHLAWAAVSGMEITLYTALVLLLLVLYLARRDAPWLWGLVGGALTLTRPEGLLLVGLLAAHRLWQGRSELRATSQALAWLVAGWLLWVVPYALFNWQVSGLLFPNTFYAKQQEYGVLLATVPIWRRLASLGWQPWLGGQALFLLALPWLPWRSLRGAKGLPLLWALGIVLLYTLRLPVSYQHGRYLMPTVPIFLLYGIAAFGFALRRLPSVLQRPVGAGAITAFALFLFLGASAYGTDVSVIECEMGAAARWVAEQSAPGDLVAAHDIGRLGYLTEQPILDFAGLISPETIPILRDEAALLELAIAREARYLVTFADWYPIMVKDPRLTPLHATNCAPTRAAGGKPMTVYGVQILD